MISKDLQTEWAEKAWNSKVADNTYLRPWSMLTDKQKQEQIFEVNQILKSLLNLAIKEVYNDDLYAPFERVVVNHSRFHLEKSMLPCDVEESHSDEN